MTFGDARVTVSLTDGRHCVGSEIRGKFRELAGVVLQPTGVSSVEDAVDRCEQWRSVAELTELLRRHGLG